MWNYNFVFPSLMVLAIFLAFYFARPRLPVRVNRTFLQLLVCDILVIFLDLAASEADTYYDKTEPWVLWTFNLLYFLAYMARVYLFYLYIADILHLRWEKVGWMFLGVRLPYYLCQLVALSSPWTGAVFCIDAEGYHRGPLYDVLYICTFFYLFLSVLMLLIFRKKLSRFELASGLAVNGILLLGTLLRILLPQVLVMNTFCLMAIVVIFIAFENPDLFLSDRGNAFNMRALQAVLTERAGRKPYRMLGFVLRNYNDERGIYGGRQMDGGITMINQYLISAFPGKLVFYLRSGCFALLGGEDMDLEQTREEIARRFEKPWTNKEADLYLEPAFIRFEPDMQHQDPDRILSTMMLAYEEADRKLPTGETALDVDKLMEIDRQVNVKRALEHALEKNSVEVFLQPLVDSHTRKVVAAEALARIRDEAGEIIPPGEFIPMAERNGQINRLGEQVFEKTCSYLRKTDACGDLAWINVNLSPIQCIRRDLGDQLFSILDRYGVDADRIHLEITEESMVDMDQFAQQIHSLQQKGFQFALDDYGSGYSNLSRVKRSFFVSIKLDMSLVWDYFHRRDSLLPAVVQVFRQMGFTVTAEGIETEEMADCLTEIGCDYLQGFYFSRPIPMEEFSQKYL